MGKRGENDEAKSGVCVKRIMRERTYEKLKKG
jgi:hypothetical protein